MSTLHSLKAPFHSRHSKKRVGRGQGSGLGKTAGRGGKGQKARSGNMHFEGFEGGQSPLQRRLPKFGFTQPNRVEYSIVNVADLERFAAGSTVDLEAFKKSGLVKGRDTLVKVLGEGTLAKKLVVKAHKFSASAKALIEKAGGSTEEIPTVVHAADGLTKANGRKRQVEAKKVEAKK
jgi:large subunit ribosomal protein L15